METQHTEKPNTQEIKENSKEKHTYPEKTQIKKHTKKINGIKNIKKTK